MDFMRFHVSTPLLIGEGVSDRIGECLAERGLSRPLLVTDPGVERAGIAERIRRGICMAGRRVTTYAEVSANPTVGNVQRGCELLAFGGCDAVVAAGGGSSIDAAKAISMLSANGGNVLDYEMGKRPATRAGPPLFAIPTTAGTGSEVTSSAVITDRRSRRKFDVKSPFMAPSAALVDPSLTLSLPPSLTASTGMDALCHAVEAYTAKNAGPVSDVLALGAVELAGRHLLPAYRDGTDRKARRGMMTASLTAGMAFANAGLGAVHGLSAPLGGRFDVPHGVANALMLPAVMAFNLDCRRERYARVARALGCAEPTAEAALDWIREMIRLFAVPPLRSFGVSEEELDRLAADSLGPYSNCSDNPRPVTHGDAVGLLRKALGR